MSAVLEAQVLQTYWQNHLGSANPHNVVKATFKALASLREPIAVAKTRTYFFKESI